MKIFRAMMMRMMPLMAPFSARMRRMLKDIQRLKSMVEMIDHTQEQEIACDETFHLLDEFTDAVLRGEDTAELMPLVKHHLAMCMDCREEYEVLLKSLKAAQD